MREHGYWWAYEDIDPLDNDWLLVFVELDGSIWYGKCNFEESLFSKWEKQKYFHQSIPKRKNEASI